MRKTEPVNELEQYKLKKINIATVDRWRWRSREVAQKHLNRNDND